MIAPNSVANAYLHVKQEPIDDDIPDDMQIDGEVSRRDMQKGKYLPLVNGVDSGSSVNSTLEQP